MALDLTHPEGSVEIVLNKPLRLGNLGIRIDEPGGAFFPHDSVEIFEIGSDTGKGRIVLKEEYKVYKFRHLDSPYLFKSFEPDRLIIGVQKSQLISIKYLGSDRVVFSA